MIFIPALAVETDFGLILLSTTTQIFVRGIIVPMTAVRSIVRKIRGKTQQPADVWPDPVRNPAASEFEVDLWILSRFLLEKIVPVVGTHPYPLNELLLMTAAACRLKPSVVFDWGTHIGVSARIFYECDKAFKLDYEIHSVDLPPDASHVEHPGQEHGRLVKGLDRCSSAPRQRR